MLAVRGLSCVRGDHCLFADLGFSVQAGELLRVRGHNGSGKTTLLRTLCGLTLPAEGEIFWQDSNIRSLGDEYFRDLTYIGHLNGVKDDLTAAENLTVASRLSGAPADRNAIYDALERIGLGGREDLPVKVLSQGQRRRVALARLLFSNTRLWILDEPYTALDVGAVAMLQGVIARHLERGGLTILTTHQDVEIEGVVRELNLSR